MYALPHMCAHASTHTQRRTPPATHGNTSSHMYTAIHQTHRCTVLGQSTTTGTYVPPRTCTSHVCASHTHTIRNTRTVSGRHIYSQTHHHAHVHLQTHTPPLRPGCYTQETRATWLSRSPFGGSHRPAWDTRIPFTCSHSGRTQPLEGLVAVYGLFCSRCPGEPGSYPLCVPHCLLLSSPGRGLLPGRAGSQQGQPVGQVSASPSCRLCIHKPCLLQPIPWQAWGGSGGKEGPPPGSARTGQVRLWQDR